MKYRYIGQCAAGFVQFRRNDEPPVVMPEGEAVEVPGWLESKIKTNNHFEAVMDEVEESAPVESFVTEAPKKRGRKPKVAESDAGGA